MVAADSTDNTTAQSGPITCMQIRNTHTPTHTRAHTHTCTHAHNTHAHSRTHVGTQHTRTPTPTHTAHACMHPQAGWTVTAANSSTKWADVDFSEGEWTEYDEKAEER